MKVMWRNYRNYMEKYRELEGEKDDVMFMKVIKSMFYLLSWKVVYGKNIIVKFPLALEKVKIEKDRTARIVLGEKV